MSASCLLRSTLSRKRTYQKVRARCASEESYLPRRLMQIRSESCKKDSTSIRLSIKAGSTITTGRRLPISLGFRRLQSSYERETCSLMGSEPTKRDGGRRGTSSILTKGDGSGTSLMRSIRSLGIDGSGSPLKDQ